MNVKELQAQAEAVEGSARRGLIGRRLLLAAYGIMLLMVGVLFVPYKLIYGPQLEVFDAKYAPLWLLIDHNSDVNGFHPLYELQAGRWMCTVLIVTLIFLVAYLLLLPGKLDPRKKLG